MELEAIIGETSDFERQCQEEKATLQAKYAERHAALERIKAEHAPIRAALEALESWESCPADRRFTLPAFWDLQDNVAGVLAGLAQRERFHRELAEEVLDGLEAMAERHSEAREAIRTARARVEAKEQAEAERILHLLHKSGWRPPAGKGAK